MKLGFIGLGKMGIEIALRLKVKGHEVVAYNRSEEPRKIAESEGLYVVDSVEKMLSELPSPKIIWLMVSWNAVDQVLESLLPGLQKGDIVIDGGNSPYKLSIERKTKLENLGIGFVDAGVSGGPFANKNGGWCIMAGGDDEIISQVEILFKDLGTVNGYQHIGKVGSGHFTKMVHNAIEYGMMQAIGEGFEILKQEELTKDNLVKISNIYQNGSVIESRLVGWLKHALENYGTDLERFPSQVHQNGEGEWTVNYAKEKGIDVPVMQDSVDFRKRSGEKPTFIGKVLSALRFEFGGHTDNSIK